MAVTIDGTTGVSLVQDGVITDANLPAGSVIQTAYKSLHSILTINSTGTWTDLTDASITFTPKQADSTLLIDAVTHVFVDGNSGDWESAQTRIVVGSDAQTVTGENAGSLFGVAIRDASNDDIRMMAYEVKSWEYDVSSTNAVTVKIQAQASYLMGGVSLNSYGSGSLRIMEIAG